MIEIMSSGRFDTLSTGIDARNLCFYDVYPNTWPAHLFVISGTYSCHHALRREPSKPSALPARANIDSNSDFLTVNC